MNNSPYYKAIGKEVEVFHHTFQQKLPFLLKGPTGTGKSRFIEFMAHSLGKELITVSCHEETSSTDLIGRYIIKGAETVWLDGPLTTAVKKKGNFIFRRNCRSKTRCFSGNSFINRPQKRIIY